MVTEENNLVVHFWGTAFSIKENKHNKWNLRRGMAEELSQWHGFSKGMLSWELIY
jgi:hypothetical protein